MAETATANAHGGHGAGGTRRDFLSLTATAVTGVGVVAFAWPFIASMNPSASVLALASTDVDLALWHGFNLALGMTVASVLLGIAMYRAWSLLRHTTPLVERVLGFWPSDAYRYILDGINRVSRGVTRVLQSGYLRQYLFVILLATVGFVGSTLMMKDGLPLALAWTELRFYEAGLALLMLLAAIYALFAPDRLSTVASLGIVGYGVALIYILYGAPDLAMTQILVETLTVLLFVLAFYHLPRFNSFSSPASRVRDAIIAACTGGLMTALILAATSTPPQSRLAGFFAENSKTVAHGSNIVNVILVDFRGLDTLGEMTVLSIAAFGVYALLKLGRKQRRARIEDRHSALTRLRGALSRGSRRRKGTGA